MTRKKIARKSVLTLTDGGAEARLLRDGLRTDLYALLSIAADLDQRISSMRLPGVKRLLVEIHEAMEKFSEVSPARNKEFEAARFANALENQYRLFKIAEVSPKRQLLSLESFRYYLDGEELKDHHIASLVLESFRSNDPEVRGIREMAIDRAAKVIGIGRSTLRRWCASYNKLGNSGVYGLRYLPTGDLLKFTLERLLLFNRGDAHQITIKALQLREIENRVGLPPK